MSLPAIRGFVTQHGPAALRLLFPPFHNRVTWFLVIFGAGLMSTPLWWTIAAQYLYDRFGLHLPSDAEPAWGFGLIVLGLAYNLISVSLKDYVAFLATRAIDTDKKLLDVAIFATRRGTRQFAQVRVRNDGRRPVNVVSWWAVLS